MPVAERSFGWQEATAAFAVILLASFLVTWVVTDLVRVRRAPYVAILLTVALALAAGYVAWSGTSASDLVVSGWGWGVVAGVLAAAAAFPLVRRLPSHPRAGGARLGALLLWEGVAYGIAEALLLATLPALAVWHAASDGGRTTDGWAGAGSGAMAVGAALLVILAHHLGYAEFRARSGRPKLLGALVTCGIQAIAFLVTGNVLAPVVAHVVLHGQMILRGVELPPVMPRAEGVREVGGHPEMLVRAPDRDGART